MGEGTVLSLLSAQGDDVVDHPGAGLVQVGDYKVLLLDPPRHFLGRRLGFRQSILSVSLHQQRGVADLIRCNNGPEFTAKVVR